jgi:hypothetical protein
MDDVTGIELGPNHCVLVRARRGASAAVSAARIVTPGEWSADHDELTDLLKRARRRNRLPAHAHVVAWGNPQKAVSGESLRPFVSAGFDVKAVLSPVQALARIARGRRAHAKGQAVAALALNTHGAAIAIVRNDDVLFWRVFDWALGKPFTGQRPELLDRYLLVSQLAPHVQHGIELVRPVHGARVTSAITCGNLHDLRSLTMAVIEELDIEVEALDSAELPGLGGVAQGRLVESAAALQLASAAASHQDTNVPSGLHGAVAATVPASAGGSTSVEAPRAADSPRPVSSSPLLRAAAVTAMALAGAWSFLLWSGSSPAVPIARAVLPVTAPVEVADGRVVPTTGRFEPEPSVPASSQSAAARGSPVVRETAAAPDRPPTAERRLDPPPAPLPLVNGIMVSGRARMAIVDGSVVSQGDRVGPRLVVRIDRDGVVLRDGSGREVLVPVGGRRDDGGGS